MVTGEIAARSAPPTLKIKRETLTPTLSPEGLIFTHRFFMHKVASPFSG